MLQIFAAKNVRSMFLCFSKILPITFLCLVLSVISFIDYKSILEKYSFQNEHFHELRRKFPFSDLFESIKRK